MKPDPTSGVSTHHSNDSKNLIASFEHPNRLKDADAVIDHEAKYLELNEKANRTGIAISGGGIRSASFGLGVLQALVANIDGPQPRPNNSDYQRNGDDSEGKLAKMDYMSTVSGGGFLGSALTWALDQDPDSGVSPENFPLGTRKSKGVRGEIPDAKEAQKIRSNDNKEPQNNNLLNFIRQHGDYLFPHSLGPVSFAAVIVRSILISLVVYFSFLITLMISGLHF